MQYCTMLAWSLIGRRCAELSLRFKLDYASYLTMASWL